MNKRKFTFDSLAPFFLFTVFTISVVAVLIGGAKIYRNQSNADLFGYEKRTAALYISTRVRQNDLDGMCFVGDFYTAQPSDEGNTLFLYEDIGGELYYTCIYCYNGYLYELFAEAGNDFTPADGEAIIEIGALRFKNESCLICAEITYKDGTSRSLMLYPRSTQKAVSK